VSDGTKIAYTDASWPVVAGCTQLSPGCDHCWSARLTSGRLRRQPAYAGLAEGGRFTGQVRMLSDRLGWPRRWHRPRRVFVCSAADLFHPRVPDEFIAEVFAVMAAAPRHTFLVLTKRAARMRSLVGGADGSGHPLLEATRSEATAQALYDAEWPLPNVHLGVSVEDQHWADIRIPHLLATPAAVRWVSAEPLLGPVDLRLDGPVPGAMSGEQHPVALDWVVIGGESGCGARPMPAEWLTGLADQCVRADVPVFVKQASGLRAGQQGAIPDRYWVLKRFPGSAT
jgi:protein gp37